MPTLIRPSVLSRARWAAALLLSLGAWSTVALAQEAQNWSVTRSPLGAWVLRDDASAPGMHCAVRFVSAKRGGPELAIFGPTPKDTSSTLLFSSADIPRSRELQDVDVDLWQRDTATRTPLKAKLLPTPPNAPAGQLAVKVGDVSRLMQSMRDREQGLRALIGRQVVFELDYDGLEKARSAMLDCVAGKRYAGRTLDEGMAELRPVGKSTLKGQAFYKGALFARKEYPPKGSAAVGLVWMTDEFKAWYQQLVATKKAPERIPEHIAKHFMQTTIVDDEGGFVFTRLPAGEYMLVANFSYDKTMVKQEVIGQTHTFAGNRHIGTQDHVAHWSYTIKQPTTFQKTVVIKNDGDTLDVSLDKSQIMCFFVCF
jgi:hypothetical protein